MCLLRTLLACVPMAGILWWMHGRVAWLETGFSVASVAWLVFGVVAGGLAYLAAQWGLRSPELRLFLSALERRVGHPERSRDEAS